MNPDNTIKQQFVYADGVNSPEYMYAGLVRYHFVKDHRGSILKVVNVATGDITQELTYSEFGEVLTDTNPGFQPFGFAGGLYDKDTKLVKFGARDYDGRVGRWLSKDPIRFEGGDTNLYGYVLNDPVNFVDPSGLVNWTQAAAGVGLTVVGTALITYGVASPDITGITKVAGITTGSVAVGAGIVLLMDALVDEAKAEKGNQCR